MEEDHECICGKPQDIRNIGFISFQSDSTQALCLQFKESLSLYHKNLFDNHMEVLLSQATIQFQLYHECKQKRQGFIVNITIFNVYNNQQQFFQQNLFLVDSMFIIVDAYYGVTEWMKTVLMQILRQKVKPIILIDSLEKITENVERKNNIYATILSIRNELSTLCQSFGEQCGMLFKFSEGNLLLGSLNDKILVGSDFFKDRPKQQAFEKIIRYFCRNQHGQSQKQLNLQSIIHQKPNFEKDANNEAQIRQKIAEKSMLNVKEVIINTAINFLPSPLIAQRYRYKIYFPFECQISNSIRLCDPHGPLMIYIFKINYFNNSAFGRVFSGKVINQTVRIVAKKTTIVYRTITEARMSLNENMRVNPLGQIGAGNVVYLSKVSCDCGDTLTSQPAVRQVPAFVNPARSTVKSDNCLIDVVPAMVNDLPGLVDCLNSLAKSNNYIQTASQETGVNLLTGSYEAVQAAFLELKHAFSGPLVQHKLQLRYREVPTCETDQANMVKSANRHNRIYAGASLIDENLLEAMDKFEINAQQDSKQRGRNLVDNFNWQERDSRNILCFGPHQNGTNILVNNTRGVHYLAETKDTLCSAFQYSVSSGALCGEEVRGIRVNLDDLIVYVDAIHRGAGQILPAARRLFHGLELKCEPILYEPSRMAQYCIPSNLIHPILAELQSNYPSVQICQWNEYRWGNNGVGLVGPLSNLIRFDGWSKKLGGIHKDRVEDSWMPLQEGSAIQIVMEVRNRKGMKLKVPSYLQFLDRL